MSRAAADLLNGLGQLLTVGMPAPGTAALLAAPVAVCWATGAVASWLAVRSRIAALPLLPPLLAFLVALAVTAPTGGPGLPATAAFVLTAVLVILARTPGPARALRPLPLLAATCAVGLAAGALLGGAGGRPRLDPRPYLVPGPEVTVEASPMLDLKPLLLTDPPQVLFRVRPVGPQPPGPLLLRSAVLNEFDGGLWRSAEVFTRPAARYPPPDTAVQLRTLRLEVTVVQPRGVWLLDPGQVVGIEQAAGIEGGGILRGQRSGTLISQRPAPGLRYTVTARVPTSSRPSGLDSAIADQAAVADGATRLPPDLQAALQQDATLLVQDATSPYQQLTRIESRLRGLAYGTTAPPGESFATIRRMLSLEAPYQVSFAEQRASAFAALARGMGLPARVAVGYRIPRAGPGAVAVTTAQADAWPEVALRGYGWVPFQPTDPGQQAVPRPAASPTATPSPTATRTPTGTATPGGNSSPSVPPSPSSGTGPRPIRVPVVGRSTPPTWPWWLLLGGIAALLAGAELATVAKSLRRSRRRRARSPQRRLAGAWAEVLDRLAERGIRPLPSATPAEIARAVTGQLGAGPSTILQAMADVLAHAVYGPRPPTGELADRAWSLEEEFRRALQLRTSSWRLRLYRADPRVLLRG